MPFHSYSKPNYLIRANSTVEEPRKHVNVKVLSAWNNNNLISELLWNSDLFQFCASQWIFQILIWIWLHTIKTNCFPRVYEAIYRFTLIASCHNLPVQSLAIFSFVKCIETIIFVSVVNCEAGTYFSLPWYCAFVLFCVKWQLPSYI